MLDPHGEEVLPLVDHVLEHRVDVARPHVAAPQPRRPVINLRDPQDRFLAVLSGNRIAKRRLDLPRQMVAGRRERVVHPFQNRNGSRVLERVDNVGGRKRAEAMHVQASGPNPFFAPQPIDGRLRRLHVAAHADQNVLGILAAIRHHKIVPPPRLVKELVERLGQRRLHLVVVPPLGDLPLHVRILILHDPRHHRVGRIHQVHELVLRIADELAHEFRLDQPDALHRVRGEEAVLTIEERSVRRLSRPPRDETHVARLLRIASKQDSPPAVGNAHHIIVPRMHIEPLARERPGADVEHRRQPLAGDRVEHFFHQHEPLARREIRHPPARRREPFAERCARVFTLRFDEHQLVAPQIRHTVGHCLIEPAAHRGGTGDRKCTATLRDAGLDPDDGLGAVARGRNARVLKRVLVRGPGRWNIRTPTIRFVGHATDRLGSHRGPPTG